MKYDNDHYEAMDIALIGAMKELKRNNPNCFIRAGQTIIKMTFYHNRKKKGVPMADEYLYSVVGGITFLRLWIGKMEFPLQSTGNCFLTNK